MGRQITGRHFLKRNNSHLKKKKQALVRFEQHDRCHHMRNCCSWHTCIPSLSETPKFLNSLSAKAASDTVKQVVNPKKT